MSWNYRVVHRVIDGVDTFAIHEAYYTDTGQVWTVTQESSEPQGETLDELQEDLQAYCAALNAPVLEWDNVATQAQIRHNTGANQAETEIGHGEATND